MKTQHSQKGDLIVVEWREVYVFFFHEQRK